MIDEELQLGGAREQHYSMAHRVPPRLLVVRADQ